MCGLAGLFSHHLSSDQLHHELKKMGDSIQHRGPDAQGIWKDNQTPFGFVHQRLSIIDLSEHGNQPMLSKSTRYVIAYNGEIYNFKALKEELLQNYSIPFSGHSDTEVLLACLENWGIKKTLDKISGMFAFALWDQKEKKLTLARDHVGIKPLYYGWNQNNFFFTSELHALKVSSLFSRSLSRTALASFIRYSYIPCPQSIYQDILKLPPGHYLELKPDSSKKITLIKYWGASEQYQEKRNALSNLSESELISNLDSVLTDSVKRHMISDVPLGTFLSGGIDSSLVAALMQKNNPQAIKTFTIGFNEKGYNEATHAKAIASHLGTDHTEVYLDPNDVVKKVPHILTFCDEPFADSSQLPTWYVSYITRKSVTVSMSGDGGDELFCGYNRYLWTETLWKSINKLPKVAKTTLSSLIKLFPDDSLDSLYLILKHLFPKKYHVEHFSQKCNRLSNILISNTPQQLYHYIVSQEFSPEKIVLSSKPEYPLNACHWTDQYSLHENMMQTDLQTYLPDDILTKVDRASMAVSLEARVPLLEREVIEFAFSIPQKFKYGPLGGKDVLKKVLYQYIPKEIMERPKMGFGVPIGQWMKGPLKEWSEDLLNQRTLEQQGYFDARSILKKWDEHKRYPSVQHEYYLWNILVFQNWLHNNT